jgi:hypothetical protein
MFELRPALLRIATLGAIVPDWARVRYPRYPSLGRFEADHFVPHRWKPHYPNPAFLNARDDDAFWAARRVAAFSDGAIRAAVKTGRLSDPQAEAYLVDVLIKRRDAVARTWLPRLTPIVDVAMDVNGDGGGRGLRFANAAGDARAATAPAQYQLQWRTFGNDTHTAGPAIATQRGPDPRFLIPEQVAGLPAGRFLLVEISATHPQHPAWSQPVRVFLGRHAAAWRVVGLERGAPSHGG